MNREEYAIAFSDFVRNRLTTFYNGIAPFYIERSGSPDSLSYFRNHYDRFWAMIEMIRGAGVYAPRKCEVGSWYPYTTYYFREHGLDIDLYDIMPRICNTPAYDVDGVRLYDTNVCTEEFQGAGNYDLIILSEVMEHLPIDLFAFEKKVQALLAPGGHILVTYPMEYQNNAKDYGLQIGDPNVLHEPHLREFTPETVELFGKGLKLIDSRDFTYWAYGRMFLRLYRKE